MTKEISVCKDCLKELSDHYEIPDGILLRVLTEKYYITEFMWDEVTGFLRYPDENFSDKESLIYMRNLFDLCIYIKNLKTQDKENTERKSISINKENFEKLIELNKKQTRRKIND